MSRATDTIGAGAFGVIAAGSVGSLIKSVKQLVTNYKTDKKVRIDDVTSVVIAGVCTAVSSGAAYLYAKDLAASGQQPMLGHTPNAESESYHIEA